MFFSEIMESKWSLIALMFILVVHPSVLDAHREHKVSNFLIELLIKTLKI